MKKQVSSSKKEMKIGQDFISVDNVRGDENLFRVSINQAFKGYIQHREGQFHRIDGSDIHNLLFAKICQQMEY